jgi:hypothetical protein
MTKHIETLITALGDLLEMSHDTRYVPRKIADRSNPTFIRQAYALGVPKSDLAAMVGCTEEAIRQCVTHVTYRDV